MTIENDAVTKLIPKPLPELVPQLSHHTTVNTFVCHFAGCAQTDDFKDVFRASSPTGFVPGSMQQRLQRNSFTNKQDTDSLWPIELMPSDRKQINRQ